MPIRRILTATRERRAAWRVCGGARLVYWPEAKVEKIRLHIIFRPEEFWVQPVLLMKD